MERLCGVWLDEWAARDDSEAVHAGIDCYEALVAFCPFTDWVRAGWYVMPTRGPARLLGGEEAVLRALRELVTMTTGLVPRLGVADGLFASLHATRREVRVAPGATTAFRRALPIESLLDAELATLAHRLGLHTVGSFGDLPPARVTERFHRSVLRRHAIARGERDDDALRDAAWASRVAHVQGRGAAPAGQLGFFGERHERDHRAALVQHRLAARFGASSILTASVIGGRTPDQRGAWQSWGDGVSSADATAPWPGALPAPLPVVTCATPLSVRVVDDTGAVVRVGQRGLLSSSPAYVDVVGRGPRAVRWWAGPWLHDESWWSTRTRRAHLQVVLEGDLALWLYATGEQWCLGGVYD